MSVSGARPVKLATRQLEKVWGSTALEPWYPNPAGKIGEVWFETVPEIPLLIKFIFTSERLSIQVHPDDAAAQAAGEARGKTEMWYIVRSDPGGAIGIGLRESMAPRRLREACESGEIEGLVNWLPVQPGDVIFVPAGTIHAIGAGLALCEIQQLSDTTYRLYDYGRPRELHLEKGVAVSDAGPYGVRLEPERLEDGTRLVSSRYFNTDELRVDDEQAYASDEVRPCIVVCVRGAGRISDDEYKQGEAWLVPAGSGVLRIAPTEPSTFLRTYVP